MGPKLCQLAVKLACAGAFLSITATASAGPFL
jgi:hypothetical protein